MEYNTRIRSWQLNIEFERKCTVGLLGHFAGTFTGYYICLGSLILVDSSSVLILLTPLCSCLHQPVLRGQSVYSTVLSASLTSPRMYEVLPSGLQLILPSLVQHCEFEEWWRGLQSRRVLLPTRHLT